MSVITDLRTASPDDAASVLKQGGPVMITAWQASAWEKRYPDAVSQATIVLPDFVHYARLINTGQAAAVPQLPKNLLRAVVAGVRAGFLVGRAPLKAARKDFWTVARVLFQYDLSLLPSVARGPLVLHPSLMDFAIAFDRQSDLAWYLTKMRASRRPAGVFTQQLPAAVSALSRWRLVPDEMLYLRLPHDGAGAAVLEAAAEGEWARTRWVADVSSLPTDVQQKLSAGEPWADGWPVVDGGVLVGPGLRVGKAQAT